MVMMMVAVMMVMMVMMVEEHVFNPTLAGLMN